MAVIHILDDQLANQIAAGEVVERPASVVKELVENAIDAGSTLIDVTVEEGGLSLIQIKDNGSGIAEDDVETAFQRHATSKISTSRDLFAIRSLGFRGEALASIAAVAKVEMLTATDESGLGRRVLIEGGKLIEHGPAQAVKGTTFTVKELFFNTPARLKYMKTIQTELGHISDLMYRLALSYPEIGFTLQHNGNMLLQTLGNGDLLQVIAAIYGVHTAKQMIPIKAEQLDYVIEGYIGKPECTRSNRNAMSWFVNGRYVRSFSLNSAALRAYHTLLPINRYPVMVLQAKMHPTLVDVNVHPAKMEVRFSKETELNDFVEQTLRNELSGQPLIPLAVPVAKAKIRTMVEQPKWGWGTTRNEAGSPVRPMGELVPPEPPQEIQQDLFSSTDNKELERLDDQRETIDAEKRTVQSYNRDPRPTSWVQKEGQETYAPKDSFSPDTIQPATQQQQQTGINQTIIAETSVNKYDEQKRQPFDQRPPSTASRSYSPDASTRQPIDSGRGTTQVPWEQVYKQPASGDVALPAFPAMSYIGQYHGTYLVYGNEEGMFLIDQHAAHERVNYEYYVEKFGKPIEAFQELLMPLTLELTTHEAARIRDRLPLLEQVGLGLEPFGAQTFLVRSYPHWFPEGEEESLIQEMLDWVLKEKAPDITSIREASAIMCSCKASIKANQRITQAEADTLIARLGECKQPYTCPHGRPIVVKFTNHDLEKMFKRIM
ncbi:DNA mismatch repair endonuclease MutL [Paenibacillus marinisediminis]